MEIQADKITIKKVVVQLVCMTNVQHLPGEERGGVNNLHRCGGNGGAGRRGAADQTHHSSGQLRSCPRQCGRRDEEFKAGSGTSFL